MLGTIVYDHVNHYAGSPARTIALTVDVIALDDAPLAARAPVLLEFVDRILRMILRMPLPIRGVIVNSVGSSEILPLQRGKKMLRYAFLRPEAVPPNNDCEEENENNCRDCAVLFSPLFFRMILFGVQ